MTWQKHIIKKQVIELQISKGIDSREVQNRVSQLFRDHIVQQLDKLLGDISPPGTIDKIDRLELNLGRISFSELEKELAEKMEAELQRTLSSAPELSLPARSNTNISDVRKSGSDPDLVTYFLQTGVLPWWATGNTRQTFEQALQECLVNKPSELRKLLEELLHHEAVLARLVYSCDDARLYTIIESFNPGVTAAIEMRKVKWEKLVNGNAEYPEFRQLWWRGVFHVALKELALSSETFAGNAVAEFVVHAPEFWPALMKENQLSVYGFALYTAQVDAALKDIHSYLNALTETDDAGGVVWQHLEHLSAELKTLQNLPENDKAGFVAEVEVKTILARLRNHASELYGLVKEISGKAAPQMTQLHSMLVDVIALTESLSTMPPPRRSGDNSGPHLRNPGKQNVQVKKLYDPFSETEKIYIQNAGLVLLWPFLTRFFQNIELVSDKAFVDETAREKACLMLQYLAGSPLEEVFESQLPLNKVMCGIDLEQPVNTQRFIQPRETQASENFLAAVIQNGPLWKTLSVNGFRQSYLNREGALSTRDGTWLLQVKRETYDVIVDRLPWTVQVVKLPWMERLIFVEW